MFGCMALVALCLLAKVIESDCDCVFSLGNLRVRFKNKSVESLADSPVGVGDDAQQSVFLGVSAFLRHHEMAFTSRVFFALDVCVMDG